MAMRIREAADLAGISVRTLHYYDEIGLLSPQTDAASGYRLYSDQDLELLQQILFFRELGFPLKKIKEIVSDPSYDRLEALHLQRNMLLEKRRRLDRMIATIDKTIQHLKGEVEMTNREKFAGFDFSRNPYEEEARQRWGDPAVNASVQKLKGMSKEEQEKLGEQMNAIFRKLAALRDGSPESDEAQAAIKEWFDVLNQMGNYSLEAFKGLGRMYVDDERFTRNIDQFGEGLAAFMSDAMAAFADRNRN